MPLERAISEFRFAYGVDAEARKMRQPPGHAGARFHAGAVREAVSTRVFVDGSASGHESGSSRWTHWRRRSKKCDCTTAITTTASCAIARGAGSNLRPASGSSISCSGDDSRRRHFRLDEIWKDIVSVEAPGRFIDSMGQNIGTGGPVRGSRSLRGNPR